MKVKIKQGKHFSCIIVKWTLEHGGQARSTIENGHNMNYYALISETTIYATDSESVIHSHIWGYTRVMLMQCSGTELLAHRKFGR